MKYEITTPDEIMDRLVNGQEIFYIRPSVHIRNGLVYCMPLTKEVFETIEDIIDDASMNDIFVAAYNPIEEEEPDDNGDDETDFDGDPDFRTN